VKSAQVGIVNVQNKLQSKDHHMKEGETSRAHLACNHLCHFTVHNWDLVLWQGL